VAGDSWALALLIRELGQAYATLVQGATPTNDSPPPDFFAYVAREQAAGWSTAWWREALRNLQPQPYPRDEAPQQTDRGLFVPVELNLNAADTQGVKRLARVARVSPAAVLFTAVSSAVAVGSGPYESAVGLPAALRDTRDLQETMGPLLNTLPVRTFWSSDLSATETVQRHAAAMESALAHKDVPYSRILKAAQIRRIPGAAPLLHLVNVDTEIPRLRLRGAKTAALHIPANWATFPALWEFSWQQIGNMSGVLRTDASFFTAEQANGLAQEFRSSLARLLK
jgi:hypothetical protein